MKIKFFLKFILGFIEQNEESEELTEGDEKHHHVKMGEKTLKRAKNSCPQCGKRFPNKISLKLHMTVHSGEKPYTCDQCGKSFTQKGHLKGHMKIHTGEKPYTCDQCGKSFIKSSVYKVHLLTHSKERLHSCDQCGKTFI